jgi:hypothetical protein
MRRFYRYLLPLAVCALTGTVTATEFQDYPPAVKQVIEQRCMVCHGCFDAPCQLKLDAFAGLGRGGNKKKVYDGTRLLTAEITPLTEDPRSAAQWREQGFYPVLGAADYRQGQLYRMLELKRTHPLPTGSPLPDSFDFRLDRDQQCAEPAEFDQFEADYPLWGMPYGMPAISDEHHQLLGRWLADGAPGVKMQSLPGAVREQLRYWEAFFNGPSMKRQLVSRYLYEHLYVGALYFGGLEDAGFFRLVRSRTAPGKPIELITTRRVYDSPGPDAFYYRLQRRQTTALRKRHMPYRLDAARMQRWRALFLEPDYDVTGLPSYSTGDASNPFKTFRDLPVNSRYQFLLDEARFTIMGFIKGPVCRGQIALNVIDDHFWVVFVDPESGDPEMNAEFILQERDNLKMPSGKSGPLLSVVEWRKYAAAQRRYLEAKSTYLTRLAEDHDVRVDTGIIWDGDGHNPNATLTIFRHFDTASVVQGLVGRVPKTAWVISYALLERIHYMLVAGFDVYGNLGHQLESRLYMEFLRMEGEYNFLVMLPEEERARLRDHWYRGAGQHVKDYVWGRRAWFNQDTDIVFETDDPKSELLLKLRELLPGAADHRYRHDDPLLAALEQVEGIPASLMPDLALLDVITTNAEPRVYTLIRNSGHTNIAYLFGEDKRRLPGEDYLTVARGFIGGYPKQFFQVHERGLAYFTASVAALATEQDYRRLMDRYGVRRNTPWFWQVSDKLQALQRELTPIEAGLLDYNRYENR